MKVNGLILSAGLSSRMGDFKPLMPLCGKTVIENSIDSMLLSGVERVVVVTGYRAQELEMVIHGRYLGETVISTRNPDFESTDMLASIKIGLEAMPECGAFFMLPGDMPIIRKETYLAVFQAMSETGAAIVFPALSGQRKHPPLISSMLIPDILSYQGPGGLRDMWKYHEDKIITVPVDDVGCWTDIDTFEQYLRCISRYQSETIKF
ncbi:MAG: nucleotidyltransferase family protein [Oscillospiraceae bacterium]|nr:nucleotidyltransferase family protein [Oscillospiraceae bacterium]